MLCLSHQSHCVCQQKDLPCTKETAWKGSNDLCLFPFRLRADLFLAVSSLCCSLAWCLYFPDPLLSESTNQSRPYLVCRLRAGGRGVVVGPIVSQSLSDVFCDNEYGPNFLFRNNGDGTFTDVAQQAGKRHLLTHPGLQLNSFLRHEQNTIHLLPFFLPVPAGVEDPMQHGRGVALADFNRDGRTDIVYGNWNGPHRLFLQLNNRKQKFKVGLDVFLG